MNALQGQLVLIELFTLGVMAEAIRANFGSKSAILLQLGPVHPKYLVEEVSPFFLTKLGKMIFRIIKILTDVSSILSQFTCLTDRQTNRQNSHR